MNRSVSENVRTCLNAWNFVTCLNIFFIHSDLLLHLFSGNKIVCICSVSKQTCTVFSACIGIVVYDTEKNQTNYVSPLWLKWVINSIFCDLSVCKDALVSISNANTF